MFSELKYLIKDMMDFFKYPDYPDYTVPNATETTHKTCSDCGGSGMGDIFRDCPHCEGTGIVRITYREYVDSLPPR